MDCSLLVAPLSMGFSSTQCSGLPFLFQGLPNPGIESASLALAGGFPDHWTTWEAPMSESSTLICEHFNLHAKRRSLVKWFRAQGMRIAHHFWNPGSWPHTVCCAQHWEYLCLCLLICKMGTMNGKLSSSLTAVSSSNQLTRTYNLSLVGRHFSSNSWNSLEDFYPGRKFSF